MNEEGNLLQLQEINSKYKHNFFTIRTILTKLILQFINGTDFKLTKHSFPYANLYKAFKWGGTYLYHILNDSKGGPSDCQQKWCQKLNRDHDINFWKQIYKINFFSIYDNSFIWFQHRTEEFFVHKNFCIKFNNLTQIFVDYVGNVSKQ